jgi:2-dehydropantoate 2-reductase
VRYIVYGAGAVGGVVGGVLFEHGNEIVLIARGDHLRAIQSHGLRVVYHDREATLPVPAVAHPSEIDFRPGDVVLLAMKTQDTEPALGALEAAAGADIPVFCLQNGVENERRAARRFANVYATLVLTVSGFLEAGSVWTASELTPSILDSGRYPSGADAVLEAVLADFNAAGLFSNAVPEIMAWKYAKLLMNLGNGVQAACGLEADTSEIVQALTAEGRAVFEAAGIAMADSGVFTERMKLIWPGPGYDRGGSSWQSAVRGTGSTEVDFLNGEIVWLGREHGVPAPMNEAVRRLANRVARERAQPGSVTPDEVRALAASLTRQV